MCTYLLSRLGILFYPIHLGQCDGDAIGTSLLDREAHLALIQYMVVGYVCRLVRRLVVNDLVHERSRVNTGGKEGMKVIRGCP